MLCDIEYIPRQTNQKKFKPTIKTCGKSFSVEHALLCPKGGLPSIRHNEIRDLIAKLLTEVCSQVSTEPELQPVPPDGLSLPTAYVQEGAIYIYIYIYIYIL